MDRTQQIQLAGADQDVEPPDTQLAAGPSMLAEATNSTLSEWSRSGGLAGWTDLNYFFQVPAGYRFADPRLLYDAPSGRWLLSGFSFDAAGDSYMYLAISDTSDPSARWGWYRFRSTTGVLTDQPMLGVSLDKVVVSWNEFTPAKSFLGERTAIFQKSELVAGTTVHLVTFSLDPSRFRIVPAQSIGSTKTEWLVYNNADCSNPSTCNTGSPTVGVVAINGTPLEANVTWNETDPSIAPTSKPPSPVQPGSVPFDTTIDDRFLSAVWQNGVMWASGNDRCVPRTTTSAHSCLRLVRISTVGTPSVTQDFDFSSDLEYDLTYPAITLDLFDDLYVAFSESSLGLYPSAAAIESSAESPTTIGTFIYLATGNAAYTGQRWGDYSSAVQDSLYPGDVWLTAEYQADRWHGNVWGTYTARAAVLPTITAVSPSSGPVNVPQHVTITGMHFQPGTTLRFGSRTATDVVVVNSNTITATVPAGSAMGPTALWLEHPDGTTGYLYPAYTYTRDVVFQSGVGPTPGSRDTHQSPGGTPGGRSTSPPPPPP